MSSSKAALKVIDSAIKAERYKDAVSECRKLLANSPRNYLASIFLGYALSKLNESEGAEEAYFAAVETRASEATAWQGLIKIYENRGSEKIDKYHEASLKLAEIYQTADQAFKCQDVIEKFIAFAKKNGTRSQYKKSLELLLPGSSIFDYLENSLPHPSQTYEEIAQITEFDEKEHINRLIGERRTRLGAKIRQVTTEVKREVMINSEIEYLYHQIINWSNNTETRRLYEEKLIQRNLDLMIVLPLGPAKTERRLKVWELATGMVIIKHPFKLAWDIALEWKDPKRVEDLDVNILRDYCALFPTAGLTSVLSGFMSSELSLFPPVPSNLAEKKASDVSESEDDEDDGGGVLLDENSTAADRLLLMTEGISDSGKSILAHRLTGEYYQYLEEYESVVELMRNGQRCIAEESAKTGLQFEKSSHHINSLLGTALVYYQSPKNHHEAKEIFEKLLENDPKSTSALIGIGLIYEEEEDYSSAIKFFDRVLEGDSSNLRVKTEAAWVKALNGDYITGKLELYKCLSELNEQDLRDRDLLAQTQYRYGVCIWNTETKKSSRKDRNGAYSYFLAALKSNLNFAPAYTSLGIFYADYNKDKKRARKCFQKAFELSSSEVGAAERLARLFAEQGEWELVEIIARRVVDSGKIRPSPGSKKKGISWPFAALAVAELNKHDFAKSIASFQSALRITPDDYHSWVGLGESYYNCGRYIAATKALQHALKLEAEAENLTFGETWYAEHMLANIKRELGDYDEAVVSYRNVLLQRKGEYSVSIALIQALVESAFDGIDNGLFGYATERAIDAIDVALTFSNINLDSFNLWKAVGDACSVFSHVQSRINDFPVAKVQKLFGTGNEKTLYDIFSEIDGVGLDVAFATGLYSEDESDGINLTRSIHASILAHKRAINSLANDRLAQSIAFYNLGWIEYEAHVYLCINFKKRSSRYLKTSIRCFKRAIEIEAGNSEFWNALGVVTSGINPKIAQHSFVRSLYLNERNARTWTNLGTLYLLQNDYLLANEAFTRAQSSDPDFAHAWVGQGILAGILTEDQKEAHILFTHAMEISESSSTLVKRQYTQSSYDQLVSSKAVVDVDNFIGILFSLKQLQSMTPHDLISQHLTSLFLEHVNDMSSALSNLESICNMVESDYELTESPVSLSRFALGKADLARCQLSLGLYNEAIESGETALQLSTEDAGNKLSEHSRKKCRLSAHLTMSLAHYYLGQVESGLQYFLPALEDSNKNPNIICILAQILWARGDSDSRNSARNYLIDSIERHSDHVHSILLLGIITLLDRDYESLEAVTASLHELRTKNSSVQVSEILRGIAALSEEKRELRVMTEIQTDILLNPSRPYGWSHFSDVTLNQHAAEMTLKTATKASLSRGDVNAQELSEAYAGTGRAADAQRAIMNAPWNVGGWNSLSTIIQKISF
ncbi:Superkiller protein 3 [Golovinomyces cichoracearum]|uniref:Superkiller protein 3 n=1 Tax=Golovinomyces cichoracearum TaxID=62708 RepID=A0A420J8C0_9PEZI|nr:Superkiller protein 3 [Golovinomyces cichoracearum]